MFELELSIYNNNKAKLQQEYPTGGYVVIFGEEILGVWHDRTDALRAGIDKYGNIAFLVKDINESDVNINFTRNLIFA
jgi:hypothetical protein